MHRCRVELALRLDGMRREGLTIEPFAHRRRIPGQCRSGARNPARKPASAHAGDEADAKREIEVLVAAVAAERDVEIDVHGSFGRPPKPLTEWRRSLFNLVKQAGADLGQTIGWQPSGGVCDGNNIAACGVPVVDTMGVRGGKIHSAEEYLIVDSLEGARCLERAYDHAPRRGGRMSFRVRPGQRRRLPSHLSDGKADRRRFHQPPAPTEATLVAKLERSACVGSPGRAKSKAATFTCSCSRRRRKRRRSAVLAKCSARSALIEPFYCYHIETLTQRSAGARPKHSATSADVDDRP